jgi:hypothetical protein
MYEHKMNPFAYAHKHTYYFRMLTLVESAPRHCHRLTVTNNNKSPEHERFGRPHRKARHAGVQQFWKGLNLATMTYNVHIRVAMLAFAVTAA